MLTIENPWYAYADADAYDDVLWSAWLEEWTAREGLDPETLTDENLERARTASYELFNYNEDKEGAPK